MQLDDLSAGSMLGPLGDDPPAPSTVDIGRAVTEGRRQRRVRRFAGAASAAGATALVVIAVWAVAGARGTPGDHAALPEAGASAGSGRAPFAGAQAGKPSAAAPAQPARTAPAAPAQCTIARLPMPDDRKQSLVTAMDPTGRYIAGRTYPQSPGGGLHVVVWDHLRPTVVDMPGDDQSIREINSSGVGVGTSYGADDTVTAWLYRGGKITMLPGGSGAEAEAINEAGVAVGSRAQRQPVVWRSVDAAPVELPLPAGARTGRAVDVDADGTVLGMLGSGPDSQAYLWLPDGSGRAIPELTGAMVYALRDGIVSAMVNEHATTFDLRTRAIRTVDGLDHNADDVNGYGWLVGIDARGRGLLVTDRGPVVLPDLVFHTPGGMHDIPWVLSDDGRTVAGQSDTKDDVIHAVIWTCT